MPQSGEDGTFGSYVVTTPINQLILRLRDLLLQMLRLLRLLIVQWMQ
jgi:hypothetical protein